MIARVRNDDKWHQVVALQMMKNDQILDSIGERGERDVGQDSLM